jgi:hypothetical protein
MEIKSFESLWQNASKINLKGGLASKICYVLIFSVIALATITILCKDRWIIIFSNTLIFFTVYTIIWKLINLAKNNPQAALMEGAEMLIHEQMMIAAKNTPMTIIKASQNIESAKLTLSETENKLLEMTDQNILDINEDKTKDNKEIL